MKKDKNPHFGRLSASHFDSWFDSARPKHFEALYRKFATPLLKFIAKRIGANPEATEEVFQETIVAAWKGFKTFRHKSAYFTWLCRIALNKIADYYRDQINESSHIVTPTLKTLANLESDEIRPEERLALEGLRRSVNDCLNLLPPDKRRLLWFRYWKELSNREISKILGISERAVEGRLYRARRAFAAAWNSKS